MRKTSDEMSRLHMAAPADWLRRIDDWRRHQPDIPSVSESVRRLVDIALATGAGKKQVPRRGPDDRTAA